MQKSGPMFLNELWEFFKRNIFVIVLAITLAVAAPWTLIFILPIAVIVMIPLFLKWKIYRAHKQMFDQANKQAGNPFSSQTHQQRRKVKSEGEVTVTMTEPTEQRINDDVGEYVDFKEVKNKETK